MSLADSQRFVPSMKTPFFVDGMSFFSRLLHCGDQK